MAVRRALGAAVALDVVELSAAVAGLARRHFGLVEDGGLAYHVQGGREFVAAARPGRFDAIVIDVCSTCARALSPKLAAVYRARAVRFHRRPE